MCNASKGINVKRSIKILGLHFTYDYHLKRKLNFDEVIDAIKGKLIIWRWRDLTIIGSIQIVRTFYRAALICLDKEVVKEVNIIIFEFIRN